MLLKLLNQSSLMKESINEYFGICHLILCEVLTLSIKYITCYIVLVSEGGALSSWKTANYLFSDDASSEDTKRCI